MRLNSWQSNEAVEIEVFGNSEFTDYWDAHVEVGFSGDGSNISATLTLKEAKKLAKRLKKAIKDASRPAETVQDIF